MNELVDVPLASRLWSEASAALMWRPATSKNQSVLGMSTWDLIGLHAWPKAIRGFGHGQLVVGVPRQYGVFAFPKPVFHRMSLYSQSGVATLLTKFVHSASRHGAKPKLLSRCVARGKRMRRNLVCGEIDWLWLEENRENTR